MVAKTTRQVELDIIAAMIRQDMRIAAILLLVCCAAHAQKASVAMPDSLTIARDEFWDMGPPNDYYDLIQIKSISGVLALDQVLITPRGQACLQPATVEERTVTVNKTMAELLGGRNPCAIPEKELHKELKRCKHCLTFSGVNVTMQANCGGKDRQIRMDILDQDIYGGHAETPANTSWTMNLLSELNDLLGPDSSRRPMFPLKQAEYKSVPDTPLVRAIGDEEFDELFGTNARVSNIVHEAELPPSPPPSVLLVSVEPFTPISPELPKYPPIGIAARIEGTVTLSFNVDAEGKTWNLKVIDGPKILQHAAEDAVTSWKFPESAWGKSGKVIFRFQLNC